MGSKSNQKSPNDLSDLAEMERVGLIRGLWAFLRVNKKWWLLPIILALLLGMGLIVLGSTAAAPFIYSLF